MIFPPRAGRPCEGVVVVHRMREKEPPHEHAVHVELGKRLSVLQGLDFAGIYDPRQQYKGRVYFLPTDTLIGIEAARRLGIRSEMDLFGGVAPHPFVATKAITHPLVSSRAYAPPGWARGFAQTVSESVLRGFTAFTVDDARVAAERLLKNGPLRLKPVRGTGGRGQVLVSDAGRLAQALQELNVVELGHYGLVLEEHLDEVVTYSVGRVRIGPIIATYLGTQRLTPDNTGVEVYGGSDLLVVRGDFDALLRLDLPQPGRQAIAQARLYDEAATRFFPGFFASRRNYDIAAGIDAGHRKRSGVLEQSWRTGGASAAEIAAIEAFQASATLNAVRASTFEVFGKGARIPDDAVIVFQGADDEIGHICKYVTVTAYGDT